MERVLLDKITESLAASYGGLVAVFLVGSCSRNEEITSKSDVDLVAVTEEWEYKENSFEVGGFTVDVAQIPLEDLAGVNRFFLFDWQHCRQIWGRSFRLPQVSENQIRFKDAIYLFFERLRLVVEKRKSDELHEIFHALSTCSDLVHFKKGNYYMRFKDKLERLPPSNFKRDFQKIYDSLYAKTSCVSVTLDDAVGYLRYAFLDLLEKKPLHERFRLKILYYLYQSPIACRLFAFHSRLKKAVHRIFEWSI